MAAQAEGGPKAKRFARAATDVIWLGPTQQAGVTHLCGEMQIRALIGPSSCGKTTLLQHFRHHLDDAVTLHIPGPRATASEVLSALLDAASLEVTDLTDDEKRSLLRVFIEQRRLLGTRIIVCADEVSGFSEEAWSEIDRLLRLKVSNKTLVELAVVGTHDEAASAPLKKTVVDGATSAVEAVRYLAPPDDEDIRRYIAWQLGRIGIEVSFSADAYSRINELCENRFAAVNALCDTIISAPGTRGKRDIDVDAVDRAADGLADPQAALPESEQPTAREPLPASEHLTAKVPLPARVPARASEPPPGREPLPISAGEVLPDRLVVSRNGKIDRIVKLDRRLVIGRGETSDLRLGDRMISRHHAMILPAGNGRFAVVDLNSSNGVLVNGRPVKRRVLRSGDTVQLCGYRLKLITAESARHDSTPAPDPSYRSRSGAKNAPKVATPAH
jgi:hypothetical protein